MKRFLAFPLIAAVAVCAWADAPARPRQGERLSQLQRNRALIAALVDGGLRLAETEDPIQRAECCNGLAAQVGKEIQKAASDHEGSRVLEMVYHFQALIKHGVADNLDSAIRLTPVGSPGELELKRVGAGVKKVTEPLENQLRNSAGPDQEEMNRALKAVQGGWEEVQSVLKIKDPPVAK